MQPTEPLPLHHSWPMIEQNQRFERGLLHDEQPPAFISLWDGSGSYPPDRGIGHWSCDLTDDRLSWDDAVYDIFGLPRSLAIGRAATVAMYAADSRAAMESLRHHAIRHCRGFTLDAEIVTPGGERRWIRLIAAPTCTDGKAVRLHGLKQDVTRLYR